MEAYIGRKQGENGEEKAKLEIEIEIEIGIGMTVDFGSKTGILREGAGAGGATEWKVCSGIVLDHSSLGLTRGVSGHFSAVGDLRLRPKKWMSKTTPLLHVGNHI